MTYDVILLNIDLTFKFNLKSYIILNEKYIIFSYIIVNILSQHTKKY